MMNICLYPVGGAEHFVGGLSAEIRKYHGKTFEDIIKGFDSDRHRVMFVAVVLMKTTLVVVIGSLPTSFFFSFSFPFF